ncbi:MAG: ABC transporter ATP-binding protein [Rhodospirillaceae bacterium]|nr:ABC transporter ATP-binding protein [Rhodospirillaceae bacterium]
MAQAKILARGVSKVFTDENGRSVSALGNLDLQVNDGEFIALLGPSGCGKSTFLYLVAGFEKPTAGTIVLDGKPIRGPAPDRGIVFQEYTLFPWRTVAGNIRFGLDIQGVPKRQAEERCRSLMALAGLTGFERAYPHQLSGGMQQRVAIARALAYDPAVLLMDEPFGALDAQTKRRLLQDLVRIWEQTKKTILFVTHSVEEALFLADRVVLFGARPARVKEIVDVAMPRPREIGSPDFAAAQRRLLTSLDEEVEKMMQRGNDAR